MWLSLNIRYYIISLVNTNRLSKYVNLVYINRNTSLLDSSPSRHVFSWSLTTSEWVSSISELWWTIKFTNLLTATIYQWNKGINNYFFTSALDPLQPTPHQPLTTHSKKKKLSLILENVFNFIPTIVLQSPPSHPHPHQKKKFVSKKYFQLQLFIFSSGPTPPQPSTPPLPHPRTLQLRIYF